MRAFYRIKYTNWPLTLGGVDSLEGWRPDCVEVGGTKTQVIVHSATHPNPALEDAGAKFLGNTYVELKSNATKTQADGVFEAVDEKRTTKGTRRFRRKQGKAKKSGAKEIRRNLIPHSWGARETVREQRDVDAL